MRPRRTGSINPRRGEVWEVNFNPTLGDEIAKIRPAIVVSSDAMGKLAIKLVVPVTTWKNGFANNLWMVRLEPNATNGLRNVSTADTLQIRGAGFERFIRKLGRMPSEVMDEIAAAVPILVEYQ